MHLPTLLVAVAACFFAASARHHQSDNTHLAKHRANHGDCPTFKQAKTGRACHQKCSHNETPQWDGSCVCRHPFHIVKHGHKTTCAPTCSNGFTLNIAGTGCVCHSGRFAAPNARTCLTVPTSETCGYNSSGKKLFYHYSAKTCVSHCPTGFIANFASFQIFHLLHLLQCCRCFVICRRTNVGDASGTLGRLHDLLGGSPDFDIYSDT
ncbi:hypothetical protein RQP46_001448 [Phenoliferia psychrophenolica]